MRNRTLLVIVAITLVGCFCACTRLQKPVTVQGRQSVVQMTADDFKFVPNNITVAAGDSVTFRIRNVSGTAHNFTLTGPQANTLQSVDIPPGQTVEVRTAFPRPGTYRFYCSKTGHSTLGMKGQVVATGG